EMADNRAGDADAFIRYRMALNAGETHSFIIKIPYHDKVVFTDKSEFENEFNKAVEFWNDKVNHVRFNLPESGNKIVNTLKANLVYILINRDLAGIQPGSRSYERSWIRDGSLTSSALLKNGIVE
ncbi:hypothetical protein RZS08_41255, partial [Arthrospira platensis SPKY1]|nr:hypothetical protein [Arthrospira platensis SPKY1]